MDEIFISYRREDTRDLSGRVYDRLSGRYGKQKVFMDTDMAPGVEFPNRFLHALNRCRAQLVMIGPQWLDAADAQHHRRLDDPQDWVRVEVKTALERAVYSKSTRRRRNRVLLLPILVKDTSMPSADHLPDDMKPLRMRLAIRLDDDERFADGMTRLYRELESEIRSLWFEVFLRFKVQIMALYIFGFLALILGLLVFFYFAHRIAFTIT